MAAPSTGSSSSAQPRRSPWVLLVLAAVLFIGSTVAAYLQAPRPNPLQPVTTFDWWRYPLEQNAFKRLPVITANLNAVFVISGTDHVWAVGDGGMIVHSDDGGRTWEQRKILLSTEAQQEQPNQSTPAKGAFLGLPELVPSAYANGKSQAQPAPQYQEPPQENAPLKTAPVQQKKSDVQPQDIIPPAANEPVTPEPAPPTLHPETAHLYAVQFINENEGWVVGDEGTILHTSDGGQTWGTQIAFTFIYDPTTRRATQTGLRALHIRNDGQQGWIVGNGGTILYTANGGQIWEPQINLIPEDLIFVRVQEGGKHGWIAGTDGTVLHSVDDGQTWKPQANGSLETIPDFPNPDGDQHKWAVNDDGTVIHTTDGGATWLPQTRGKRFEAEEAATYRVWFAPWYYPVGWLLPLGLLFVSSRQLQSPPPPESESVANHAVSDRPLEAGDPDPLDFNAIAQGLSRFLRNDKTQPPLTVAVTGAWGMGKSSLMNLLKADLERYGFRPVWFNAWHHQQEDQLLAALLENIRAQGVPPWWHPAGWGFRARLLRLRGWQHWGVWLLLLMAMTFSGGYFYEHPQTAGEALQQLRNVVETLIKLGDGSSVSVGTDSKSLFTLVVSVFASFVALRKGLTAFGVNPAVLLASASDGARVRDLGAQAGFRHKFAREFRDVTHALHPRTMLILIDDLDRCNPEKVRQVLEAINFLVSSGECYVVMGMAMEVVERGVGLGFKDVAEELLDDQTQETTSNEKKKDEGKRKRSEFARQYLEKLINIEVPVPTPTEKQTEHLVVAAAPPARTERQRPWQPTLLRSYLGALAPWLVSGLLLSILAGSFWLGKTFEMSKEEEKKQPEVAGTKQQAPSEGQTAGSVPVTPADSSTPEKDRSTGPGEFIPGQSSRSTTWPLVFPLVAVLVGGLWFVWRNRPTVVVKDSPAFAEALKIWLPVITAKQNTPRSVKRFVNKVRYLAMRQRRDEETEFPQQQTGIPESLLVALSAMQQSYAQELEQHRGLLAGVHEIREKEKKWQQEHMLGGQGLMKEASEAHDKRFGNWQTIYTYWDAFIEMAKGVRVRS